MAYQSVFVYDLELSYINDDTEYTILPDSIQYMVVDYDYDNHIMPVIYMIGNIESNLYLRMQESQFKGKISLTLFKRCKSGTSGTKIKYISDQFDYFIKDDPNPTKDFDKMVDGKGQAYKKCVIGLVKTELTRNNQHNFNAIYKDTNVSSIIQNATKHMKMVIEPFKYNYDIAEFSVPPIPSVGQFISYVDKNFSLYGSPYCYFMDFDKTYLKSNSGKYIDAKDGKFPYIAIDVRDMIQYQALIDGMVVDDSQEAYIIYVEKDKATITPDRVTSNTVGSVLSVNSSGETEQIAIDTSIITNIESDISNYTTIRTDNANAARMVAEAVQQKAAGLTIYKAHTDHSIYTPNKEFLLSNYEDNNQYTGRYYMAFKKEIYQRHGNEFRGMINIGLRLVSNYEMESSKKKRKLII